MKKNRHQRRVQKKGGGVHVCYCGKKVDLYPNKRKYWTLNPEGYVTNICKNCFKILREEGKVVGRA